jgi:hypothetical protein
VSTRVSEAGIEDEIVGSADGERAGVLGPIDEGSPPDAQPRADDAGGAVDWQAAHTELVRLARSRAGLDWLEGHWLLRALQAGAYLQFGYASFAEYIERLFGYTPRWTHEKLRVAEALEELPETAQALRDGLTSWSAVRELTRVATRETEHEWLDAAKGRTVRQIEALVSGQRRGNRPSDRPDPMKRLHVLDVCQDCKRIREGLRRAARSRIRRD